MRTRMMPGVAVLIFCASGAASAQAPAAKPPEKPGAAEPAAPAPKPFDTRLAGRWRSKPYEVSLSTDFDKSVWGPNASSVRNVELDVKPTGEATLRVTTKVVDGRGRAKPASTAVEEAQIVIGGSQEGIATRIEHAVKVVSAERRYPDEPKDKWPIEGLRVKVATFTDADGSIEIRYDTPEGRGSFWETLNREGRAPRRSS